MAIDEAFSPATQAHTPKRDSTPSPASTLHVYWGSKSGQAVKEGAKELSSIAAWLKEWARDPDTWDQNLICLGDSRRAGAEHGAKPVLLD